MTLTEALDLADCVSPTPTLAHRALVVLRQHLADACAMDVDQLRAVAPNYSRVDQIERDATAGIHNGQ